MTKEERDLLLQDLCARLPYKVMAQYYDPEDECETWDEIEGIDSSGHVEIGQYVLPIEKIKPYLFPLSSMTEEQKKEYNLIIYHNIELHCERYYSVIDVDCYEELHDFYHKNHLDYRNMIGQGLAEDATGLNIISYERLHKTC